MTLVCFDTETTGLDVQKEHIIQLSLVKIEINPSPNLFYDRPQDARSSRALHPTREGERVIQNKRQCLDLQI